MITEQDIYQKLNSIFHQIFNDDSIVLTEGTTAEDIEGWDSFNHISIVVATEAAFNIKFRTAEIEELKNIGDFVKVIEGKIGTKNS